VLIPLAVGQAVAANLSGRLLTSRGARLPLTLGGALLVSLTGGYDLSKTARKLDVDLGENGENVNKTIEHLHAVAELGVTQTHGPLLRGTVGG
jgi:hypothetical protein